MASVIIGAPLWNDVGVLYSPSYSGGSWDATLGLSNLSDRRLHRVTRSTGAAVASTVFTVDLKADRAVRVLAIPKHTISEAGTLRVRGFASVPALDSLTVGDAAWTAVGTPTRTAAAYTGPDGVPLDLIEDNDAGVAEGAYAATSFTGDGTKYGSVRVKFSTAAATTIGIFDATAAAFRHRINIAWTAGVPVATTAEGSGTITTTALGDGVYRIGFTVPSVVAANAHRFYCYAAGFAIAGTGATYFADAMAWNAATDPLVYDTGFESALPANTDAEDREGVNVPWVHVTDEDETARYWRVNINDTTNADGYVDLSRLVIAGGVQPTFNMNYGARLGYDPEGDTTRTITDGGAAVYDEREKRRRTVTFRVDGLPEAEAYSGFGGLSRRGIARQVMFVYDPDDTTLKWQRSFLATLREPSEFESAILARAHTTVTLLEEL